MEKYDLPSHLLHAGFVVAAAGQYVRQPRELVVVGGEERQGLYVVVQVLGDGPGKAHPVVGRGSAPDLVQDNEAPLRGGVQDARRLGHLDHERGLSARQPVLRPNPREDAVYHPERRAFRRDVGAGLGQEGYEGDLPQVDGLAGHVGAGDDL